MNHRRPNAGTVHTEGSGDAPEWQGLVQKDAHLRKTLNRWHSKEDLHPQGGQKVIGGRDRKIVGSSRHLFADKDVQQAPSLAAQMLTPQPSGDFGNKESAGAPQANHFVSRPSVSPKRMKNMTGLVVPSLNLTKQRSLRQPNERADLSGMVSRSKSDQVNNTSNAMGTRRSVAKRGLSVRRLLPSSELDFSVGTHGEAPLPTSSFVSATSMADKLVNLDEEDPSVTASPTVSKDSPTHEYGEMDGASLVQSNTDFDERSAGGVKPPTDSVAECPSSPCPNGNLPYLASSPVESAPSAPALGRPKRRDSISPFGRKALGVSDRLGGPMKEMSCLSPTLHAVSQHGRVELQTKTGEELSNGQRVLRTKSDQVAGLSQRQGHHGRSSRPSFAQRGHSVRQLSGSKKATRGISQSSHSSTSHRSKPTCPSRATSFASISTSVVLKMDAPKESETRMLPLLEDNFPSSEIDEARSRLGGTNTGISKRCPHPSSAMTRSPQPREINLSVPLSPVAPDKSVCSIRARAQTPHRSENDRQGASPKPEKTRKAPPLDLPPAVLSMPVHSAHSAGPSLPVHSAHSASPKPQAIRPTVSPTLSTRSMRALLTRSPSKSRNRTDLSRSPVRNRSKSPVPNRSALRPSMSKRLLSMRSLVSVNTNVAVSDEVYPNKAKRPPAVAPASLSRESSGGGEYVAKAVQRKSLIARLGDSFRLAAGTALEDDDITRTSAEDDESEIGEAAQASKPKAIVKRQASTRTSARPPDVPDPEIIVQKQHERRSLLTRLSRREINDEKTECTSVSKAVTPPPKVLARPEPPREETKRDSYVPEYIYFREFSCPEENPDDASVITEAFTLIYEGESENDVFFDGSSRKSERTSNTGINPNHQGKSAEKGDISSVVDANGSILGDMEPALVESDDPDEIVDSLLNTSPRPRLRIPRLKSLRTQSIRTKTIWNLEDSDGSLYVDNPEHQNLEDDEATLEDGDAYFSEVVNQLEKAKAREQSLSDDSTTIMKKKSRKRNQRRADSSERILIEL